MEMKQQISAGKLRCVRSGETLRLENNRLAGGKGQYYALAAGAVPVIFKNDGAAQAALAENPAMEEEYRAPSLYQRLRRRFYRDYATRKYTDCLTKFMSRSAADTVVITIGGGPGRNGEHVTNLNIGPFPNVDIAGDAHDLPYHDATVDGIFCDAVLEHVEAPITVVRECLRVLKPGGQVLSVIPFMQGFHGYPGHYQNYTLMGHEYLYRSNGFKIIASGASQGPIVTMTTLNTRFLLEYLPPVINQILGRGFQLLGLLLRPLDRLLESNPKLHVLASSTYVLAEKQA